MRDETHLAAAPYGVIWCACVQLRETRKSCQPLPMPRMLSAVGARSLLSYLWLRSARPFDRGQSQFAHPRIRFMDERPIHRRRRDPLPRAVWATLEFQSWWQGWNGGPNSVQQNSSVHIAAMPRALCGAGASK